MIFLIIYLASALICKGVTKLAYKDNSAGRIKFIQAMEGTGIDADKMLNIICLAPLVNTGIIIVWIWVILNQIFGGK